MGTNVKNPDDILIGLGELYIDGVDVGQLDGEVEFKHSKTYFEKKAGFPAATILKILQEESCATTVSLLEANLANLRGLLDEYPEYVEEEDTEAILNEEVVISSKKNMPLAHNRLAASVTVVTMEDGALVEGVDYYVDRIAGLISRVPGTENIVDGDTVKVSYSYQIFDAEGFSFGGSTTESTPHLLVFVHPRRDGKFRVLKIWKAKLGGDFVLGFKDNAESPVPLEIAAIADASKPAGQQFGVVYDTAVHPYYTEE